MVLGIFSLSLMNSARSVIFILRASFRGVKLVMRSLESLSLLRSMSSTIFRHTSRLISVGAHGEEEGGVALPVPLVHVDLEVDELEGDVPTLGPEKVNKKSRILILE